VLVESAAKARTLREALGREAQVRVCPAALRALPPARLGADPERDVEAPEALLPGREEALAGLLRAARGATEVLLAVDPDRAALAADLSEALGPAGPEGGAGVPLRWLPLPALTAEAFARARAEARPPPAGAAEAERVRRRLERLFADPLAPLLARRVRRGLVLGRLPALALCLLDGSAPDAPHGAGAGAGEPGGGWTVEARFAGPGGQRRWGRARPAAPGGLARAEAEALRVRLEGAAADLAPEPAGAAGRVPLPVLLEVARVHLGLDVRHGLALLEQLYEGVPLGGEEGAGGPRSLLSFPRDADGVEMVGAEGAEGQTPRVSAALARHGGEGLSQLYAHAWALSREAGGDGREAQAGGLVFITWALPPASAGGPAPEGRAGWRLVETRAVAVVDAASGTFTEPSLLGELLGRGVAPVGSLVEALGVLRERRLVEEVEGEGGRLRPTAAGAACAAWLAAHVPEQVSLEPAALLEQALGLVARGRLAGGEVAGEFWRPFARALARLEAEERPVAAPAAPLTDVACERCGSPMVVRQAKVGPYLGCSAWPECRATRDFREVDGRLVPVEEPYTEERCDACGRPMRVREGRHGQFLSCSGYPACRGAKALRIGVGCPACREGGVTERWSRRGKVFFGCSRYPACDFLSWDRPVEAPCPRCASPYLVQKFPRREPPYLACPRDGCGHRQEAPPPVVPAVRSGPSGG
jgi:ssDNA-binding Zn-finger/Zn-ribbon topoisomerase 1